MDNNFFCKKNRSESDNFVNNQQDTRLLYLDLLRVFSAFTVILLHVCSMPWQIYSPKTFAWQVSNFYLSTVKFNVPLFVMISGSLFLDPEYKISIKKLYKNNIIKLLLIYILWSAIYAVFTCIFDGINLNGFELVKYFINLVSDSYYHLWFLPMIISIYMIIPILKPLTEHNNSKKLIEYFLLLFIIFGIIYYSIFEFNFPYKTFINKNLAKISPPLVGSLFGYFLLGYYLKKYELKKCIKILIYTLAIGFYVFSFIASATTSFITGKPVGYLYYSFGITTFLIATLWFLLFKNNFDNKIFSPRSRKFILFLSKNTLGVYLIHAMIIRVFEEYGLSISVINPIISIPILSIAIFIISNIITYLLSKIPIIRNIV